jgi:hypothetical protein
MAEAIKQVGAGVIGLVPVGGLFVATPWILKTPFAPPWPSYGSALLVTFGVLGAGLGVIFGKRRTTERHRTGWLVVGLIGLVVLAVVFIAAREMVVVTIEQPQGDGSTQVLRYQVGLWKRDGISDADSNRELLLDNASDVDVVWSPPSIVFAGMLTFLPQLLFIFLLELIIGVLVVRKVLGS